MRKKLSEISIGFVLVCLITAPNVFFGCETFNKKNSDVPSAVSSTSATLNQVDHVFVKTWPESYSDSLQLVFFMQSDSGHRIDFKSVQSGNIYKFTLQIPTENFHGKVSMGFTVNDRNFMVSSLQNNVEVLSDDLGYRIKELFREYRQITVFKQEKQRALRLIQGETKLAEPKIKKWQLRMTQNVTNSRSESSQATVVIDGEKASTELLIPGQVYLHAGVWDKSTFLPPLTESLTFKAVTFDNPKDTFCSERTFPGGAPPTPSLTLLKCL